MQLINLKYITNIWISIQNLQLQKTKLKFTNGSWYNMKILVLILKKINKPILPSQEFFEIYKNKKFLIHYYTKNKNNYEIMHAKKKLNSKNTHIFQKKTGKPTLFMKEFIETIQLLFQKQDEKINKLEQQIKDYRIFEDDLTVLEDTRRRQDI
jgi:hypothetical protein